MKSPPNPFSGLRSTHSDWIEPRDQVPVNLLGYPQPIQAGPPGQRPWQGNSQASTTDRVVPPPQLSMEPINFPIANPGLMDPTATAEYYNFVRQAISDIDFKTADRWLPPANDFVRWAHNKPKDTLSMVDSVKYYPSGFPGTRTAEYAPLTSYTERAMGFHPDDPPFPTKEEKRTKKAKELQDWFYNGQRKWDYDILTEDEEKDLIAKLTRLKRSPNKPTESTKTQAAKLQAAIIRARQSQEGGARVDEEDGEEKTRIKTQQQDHREIDEAWTRLSETVLSQEEIKGIFAKPKPLTKEALDELAPSELARPLLSLTSRVLAAYEHSGLDSRKDLSKLGKPAEFYFDKSEQGNKSFYGEDWGAPPKKAVESLHMDRFRTVSPPKTAGDSLYTDPFLCQRCT